MASGNYITKCNTTDWCIIPSQPPDRVEFFIWVLATDRKTSQTAFAFPDRIQPMLRKPPVRKEYLQKEIELKSVSQFNLPIYGGRRGTSFMPSLLWPMSSLPILNERMPSNCQPILSQ